MALEINFEEGEPMRRATAPYSSLPELSNSFHIDSAKRSYQHQYSNIYFVRLVELRPVIEAAAAERWKGVRGKPPLLPRILDLRRANLCYVVGTVYMDMPLKPNVLEDMARSNWIAPPPPRPKFYSAQDAVHLEDESGRVRLIGDMIRREKEREGGGFVTGVIMAALGMETGNGDFEVIDLCFPGMPTLYKSPTAGPSMAVNGKGKAKAEDEMDVDQDVKPDVSAEKTWVAVVSGLSIGSETAALDLKAQLFVEWLMGEDGGPSDQIEGARIARLILAGNSLAAPVKGVDDRKIKRFSSVQKTQPYPNRPTETLSTLISDLLATSLPVTLVPGPSDPAGALMPQQPVPKVMLGGKKMEGLECLTNPTWMEAGSRSFLVSGGQTIDDVFKYLPGKSRLAMTKRTLEWRHVAPTAPDTLWIYPFPDVDPFLIRHRPDVYIIGNQPEFETMLVAGPENPTRILLLPAFSTTGTVALVCLETLEVKRLEFEVPPWVGDVKPAAV